MSMLRPWAVALGALCSALSAAAAPIGGFAETVLQTRATDPDLVNPWGIASSATSPFWVSDNGTGKATLYNTAGVKQGLVVSMPIGSESVTGQVFNGSASFNGDAFLFGTENGTITGWRGALGTNAETLFTVTGASYKGLAIASDKSTLFGANFAAGTIDVFSGAGLTGSFADATLPAGYAPFNIQNVGGTLWVTFALRGPNGDDVAGAGHGFVSVFDPASHAFTRLVSQGALNSPWGLALAPSTFGTLGGKLLIGNFGDGLINAFDAGTGALVGTLADASGLVLVNQGLWGLQFGNGGNGGRADSLYITAGPDDETGGLFAQISAVPEPAPWLSLGAGLALLMAVRRRQRAVSSHV